jgi:subtilisin family serine protease
MLRPVNIGSFAGGDGSCCRVMSGFTQFPELGLRGRNHGRPARGFPFPGSADTLIGRVLIYSQKRRPKSAPPSKGALGLEGSHMASKHARRNASRTRTIESLEERRVMSADPLAQLLGGLVEQHASSDLAEEPPALVHHQVSDADFWIDSWAERDLDTLLGDVEQTLSSAHGATGLTQVRNDYGFIGTGQTVAIIDSGIAWDHYALGGGFGEDYRVVGGWDFSEENDANPFDDGPSGSHGTHVAGIVGADLSGTAHDGVAPGVDLVGLRVFNDAGAGYFSWVEDALSWVHDNRNAFDNPITAVNLSLGAAWNSSSAPSWAMLEDEFAQLEADGIFIAVSAGNSFSTYNAPGLSYPAVSPYVVPVMSVDDGGNLSSFSQRHTSAIAAPGRGIVSTIPDYVGNQNGINDDFASFSGTSMASPYVAGASVLVREAMEFVGYANITQDTIYDHMMATATSFFDTATGQYYKRLNLSSAIDALMPSDDYGSTTASAFDVGSLTGQKTISGLIGKLNDVDVFTFTANSTGNVELTFSATHGLEPNVTFVGSTTTFNDGTWSFDVIAGQRYTFSVASAEGNGIGYYDAELTLEETFSEPPTTLKTIVRGDGAVFSLDSENWLCVNGQRTWSNTYDFSIGADETLYWQCTTGLLQHRRADGSWGTLDDNSVKFAVADNGTLYSLGADGWMSVNGSNLWSRTQDFTLAGDQTLYWHCTTGLLQHRDQFGAWRNVGDDVSRFTVRQDGTVYSLSADNWMKIDGSSTWHMTRDFVFTADQSLYWLCTNGLLQRLSHGSWATLGTEVAQFAVRQDGAVYMLTNEGRLFVDGVQQCTNVAGITTDTTGCLVIDRTIGTDLTIVGRFTVGGTDATSTGSPQAQTMQATGEAGQDASTLVAHRSADSSSGDHRQRGFQSTGANPVFADSDRLCRFNADEDRFTLIFDGFGKIERVTEAWPDTAIDFEDNVNCDSSGYAFVFAPDHLSTDEFLPELDRAIEDLFDNLVQ